MVAPARVPITILGAMVILALLHPARSQLLRRGDGLSPILAPIALLAAVPLTSYGLAQAALQRGAAASDPHAELAHYAGMTMVVLLIPLLGLLASLRTRGSRVPAWTSGVAAALLGLVWLMFPSYPFSGGTAWGTLLLVGGVAFVALLEWELRVTARDTRVPNTGAL